jgi:hypothetical protein
MLDISCRVGDADRLGSMSTNRQEHSDVVVTVGVEWSALIALTALLTAVVVVFVFFRKRRRKQ